MSPSVVRLFRPLFETIHALALGRPSRSSSELRPLRAELRKQLVALKAELTTRLPERESYLALFALVVHLDEIVRTNFPDADHTIWPLLQKELFDTDRGGELFYQSLTELLESQRLSPVLYQVYYFCLSVGFAGKYAQAPERRAQVMKKLRDWLTATVPLEIELDLEQKAPPAPARVPRVPSLFWPYALAAVAVVAVYIVLSTMASTVAARWRDGDTGARAPVMMFSGARPGADSTAAQPRLGNRG
jgi:type IV/VI secretion system ImpK/VasF family protein